MSADPVDPDELAKQARNAPLTRPRPGHADLAGMQKYGHTDARPILERASARETAARVAVGVVGKAIVKQALGIDVVSHVIELGSVAAKTGLIPAPADADKIDADPLRCLDPEASARMVAEVDAAKKDADTLGGIVEVLAYGVPPGSGVACAVGPQAGRPAGHRADVHPIGQGRGDRRRLHPGPLPRLGRARRDRPDRGRASAGSPTGRVAWRAASPTAKTCGYARR